MNEDNIRQWGDYVKRVFYSPLRDWSLVMGRGGGYKKGGGGRTSFSHAEGGGGDTTCFGVAFMR